MTSRLAVIALLCLSGAASANRLPTAFHRKRKRPIAVPRVAKKLDLQRARSAYTAGTKAYAAGRYDDAIRSFRLAYKVSGQPALLYNLSVAYERKGQLQGAIVFLEHFVRHKRKTYTRHHPDIKRLRERLAALRARHKKRPRR
ncbi:MAG: hypothetical protein KC503_06750 [Myxococcales bacterium]|nr:hypothetical protein [Myxococcales bacterium]